MAGILFVGAIATLLVLLGVMRLNQDQVIGPMGAVCLGIAYFATLVICFCQCFSAAARAEWGRVAPLGVLSLVVVLATFGIMTRMALGGVGRPAYVQQLTVLVGVMGCGAIAPGVAYVGARPKVRAWALPGFALTLVGAEIAARPVRRLPWPGGGAPANWAEPLLCVALLGWIAAVLSAERIGRLSVSAPVRLAVAPGAWVLTFALTHDLASVAVLVGGVAVWHAAERKGARPIEPGAWQLLGLGVLVSGAWMLSWGMAFRDFTGVRQLVLGSGAPATLPYRLAHLADLSPGSALRFLVPLNAVAVFCLVVGLVVTLGGIVGLLWWIAAGIEDRWAAAWAKGLAAFLGTQGVLALAGLMPGRGGGFPAPFLSESVVWNGADLVAVAVVVGLGAVGNVGAGTRMPRKADVGARASVGD